MCPFHLSFVVDEMFPKLFMESCLGNISVRSTWVHCSFVTALPQSSSKKNGSMVPCFKTTTYAVHVFECRCYPTTLWGFLLHQNTQFLELTWPFKRKWVLSENQTPWIPLHYRSFVKTTDTWLPSFSILAWVSWCLV